MKVLTKIKIGFVVTIFVLLVNVFFYYKASINFQESLLLRANSRETSRASRTLLSNLLDAETGQRGFLITGEEDYLEPYHHALKNIDESMSQLKNLCADAPNQSNNISILEKNIPIKLKELDETIETRRSKGYEAVFHIVKSHLGEKKMEEIRTSISSIDKIATEDLRLSEIKVQDSSRQFNITLLIATVMAFFLVASTYLLTIRYMHTKSESEKKLQEANTQLEIRVEERTEKLLKANLLLLEEVTERKLAEEKLQKFTKELERSNNALQDFAFVASHDLQEPLRKIHAFGDRIKTKYSKVLSNEGLDYLERMQNAAKRMERLIIDLLTYSRVTTKTQPFSQTNLHTIAKEVIDDLEETIKNNDGRVELRELSTIDADPLQMRQLIQNLIANGLKFHKTDEQPVVEVSSEIITKKQDDETIKEFCLLKVKDNGIGIDKKYQERIFQPFQRLNSKQSYEGTGMGLAICRKIVERHEGEINAKSSLGEGTTFFVALPVRHINEETKNGL